MKEIEISTRDFMEMAGFKERHFFRMRQEYGDDFPQPLRRTKDGYIYRKVDALDFIAQLVAERKASLLANVTALDERATEIKAQRLALVDGE